MKLHVSSLKLAVAAGVFLLSTGAAQAAQANLTLTPGATGCLDSPPSPNRVESFGFVSPTSQQATFRLRNVTKGQLVAGPQVSQQATFNLNGNGSPDVYRICANNNVAGQTISVTLIINGF
jgi:hypothetical protein